MTFYNQIFLFFVISLFLTTLLSKASNIPKSHAPSLSLSKSSSSSSSSSSYKTSVVSTEDVSVFVNSIMETTMSKTEEFIANVIEQRLEDPETDIYAMDCLETCKNVYQDAVDAMKKAEEDVKAKLYYKANMDISAMTIDIDTCNECVVSIYGDDSVFREFDNWIQGIASDCLDKIVSLSN